MKVSIMLTGENGQRQSDIPAVPLVLTGTPAMLDEGFFATIAKPVQKTVELITNLKAYDKALEKNRTESRMEKDQKDKETKEQTERKKKYETQIDKVKQLREQKKYGEAIGQLPKAADFPEHEAEIKSLHEELRSLHGQLSMF